MFDTRSTRTLLNPADPVRGRPDPRPQVSALALIDRAGTAGDVRRPARRTARFALSATTAVAAAAAVGVAVVASTGTDTAPAPRTEGSRAAGPVAPREANPVLTPVAYAIRNNPPSAGTELRALAGRIGTAPYDARTGRYAYVHSKTWGDPQISVQNGRYTAGCTHEDETWQAATASGVQRTTTLPYEFTDRASRDYFARRPPSGQGRSTLRVEPVGALPTTRAALARLLHADGGTGDLAKSVNTVYSRFPLDRASRAMVLEILADQAGFRWRGAVTDRAGRKGVAITGDQLGGRTVLIFDPATGALLASEHVRLDAPAPVLGAYEVFLGYDRADRAPAVPATPERAPAKPGTGPSVN